MERKTTAWRFQATNERNVSRQNIDMANKGKQEETESLGIVAQKNAIKTNYIKARIDKTQQKSKCRLRGDRD